MQRRTFWLASLSALLISCGSHQEISSVSSFDGTVKASDTQTGDDSLQWPFPEQENWVNEPVFNGKLHLIEAGQHNPQTIILVHGLGERGLLDWLTVFPQLTESYHVIAMDLPGFGQSDRQHVQYTPMAYARLVNWIAKEYAHGKVIVAGHSLGGAVSLRYAHAYPENLSRLILIDAAGILQRTVFVRYLVKTPESHTWLKPYQESIPGLNRWISKVARKADGWTRSLLVTADKLPDLADLMMSSEIARQYLYKDRGNMNAALGLVYEDFSAAAREVEVPTHIIWGEHDTVAPLRTGVLLANLLPNAQLHQIHGAGHVPMTDNFETFMSTINHSLTDQPEAKQAKRRLKLVEEDMPLKGDLFCQNQNNPVYSGFFANIQMENCQGVVLRDVVAESMELVGSEVTMENVKLTSSNTGLAAIDSVVTATLLEINAVNGMLVESSYLDLAGTRINIQNEVIEIRESARIYFSLSEYKKGSEARLLHGVSIGPTFKLQ